MKDERETTVRKGRATGPTLAGSPIVDEAERFDVQGESVGKASKMEPGETQAFEVEFDSAEGLRKAAEEIAASTGIDVETIVAKLEDLKARQALRSRAEKGASETRDAFLKLSAESTKRASGKSRKARKREEKTKTERATAATKVPKSKTKARNARRNKVARAARRKGRK